MRVALAEELGGIDSVELSERPAPAPAAGQALVRAARSVPTAYEDRLVLPDRFGTPL
jgi:hypothetical protein